MNWYKFIDVLALFIQLFGASLMYLNSPNNTEKGDYLFDEYDQIKVIEDQKNRRLKSGFLLLVFGIVVSLISTILK
ncbi:hypothetical protein KXQ82_14605 [Mucilaginibacter sp. HMF5004]|uniref:hypothetical protein n=1 Tax=Mucilaginibacter rivuli TaxID=2857527 RepID=UPI001C607A80|nr:hypothetical protein [Mucilaginibacter rivuli]MBW4890955.1 hypothetical protein [Mucilaginibacter rivuli]